jgi:diguanylate cyclase (GGDEF)-like protein
MSTRRFAPSQELNRWVEMLDTIYGPTQNYPKTAYEVLSHLTEVCGIFGKHLFKRGDFISAMKFLPKVFAWSIALLKKVRPDESDLEGIILRKFPGVCSYCVQKPCGCWKSEKPSFNAENLRLLYYRNASSLRRSVNDFQLMFRDIYERSWLGEASIRTDQELRTLMRVPYLRMIEELAEVAEAVRFQHLYPQNFENELADFFAWWFALVTCVAARQGAEPKLAEDLLWSAYPGHCLDCHMIPCFCRPGPVRELMSKPPPGHDHRFDGLTSVYNQAAYHEDIEQVMRDELPVAMPLACVRIDVDDFKKVNDAHGHSAGDAALKHMAATLRKHARERDRVYRISGDEFGILFMDYTGEEATGAMKRVCRFLAKSPVRWVSADGQVAEFTVSASIGVSECQVPDQVKAAFEAADRASYESKQGGKGRVTLAGVASPRPASS